MMMMMINRSVDLFGERERERWKENLLSGKIKQRKTKLKIDWNTIVI